MIFGRKKPENVQHYTGFEIPCMAVPWYYDRDLMQRCEYHETGLKQFCNVEFEVIFATANGEMPERSPKGILSGDWGSLVKNEILHLHINKYPFWNPLLWEYFKYKNDYQQ
jgi:hypothetical protein